MAGAVYSFEEHMIKKQARAEEAMLKELRSGAYTIDNPLVSYNLYLINPLSAVISFYTEEETAVTVTVLGKAKEGNITHTFPRAKEHVLPVVGLYSGYVNRVEVREYRGKVHTVEIEVPDVFDGDSPLESMDTTPEYLQDDCIFLSPSGAELAVAFDYAGDVRWCLNIKCVFDMKRLKNGHILMGTDRLVQMPYYMSGMYETSACGKIYHEYRLPGGSHHDAFEMPDGSLLCLTEDLTSDTVEDMCVLIDRNTGEILKTWDYKNFLEPGLGKSGSWSEKDWFHNNAVWYDEKSHSLTFSGRHMDSIVNIDFETGRLNWILSDPEGWPQEWVDRYFFKPIGTDFEWQYEQHACLITPDGDVMCFDNHHWGSKIRENYRAAKNNYSRGVRYRINTKDMTIEQIWQYGKDRGAKFFSPYICNVEYYNEGHYMVHSGGSAYNKDGEISESLGALEQNMGGTLFATTVELCDDKKMLELHTKGNYYRAEKMKLYAEQGNLELGEGSVLGEMGVTKEFDTDIPAPVSSELIPDRYEARIEDEEDRFTFHAKFEKGQLVMLMLEKGEEKHRYYISTTAVSHKAMCCGTFLESDERVTKTNVNKAGMKGTYEVFVVIDDIKYPCGVSIKC
ncbi:MAG: aryl-sulfate sulfotransferase [Hungatella hathewayi]|uniref:aryl-sulfate sulfotransferase n=1 Tax=Hungatella TaxID=1649459 RepID=UPI0011065EBD|nr:MULTISPECIES: aryl-sulfate sulfotransferase [Hungatella]MCI7383818.1 aryl-sulfate sulfotransferase [Hungatella sp.]MCQ5385510.1 aryl-sulfate sulfotransferase [Hungatella hathewayi]MDY6236216.1 aryl-sulfate sulfotransferase [Hungatella hathewayi]